MRAGGYLPTTPALWPPAPLWGGRDQSLLCYLSPSSDSLLICCKMPGLTACLTAPITVCLVPRPSVCLCHPALKLAKALRQTHGHASFYLPSTRLSSCLCTWQTPASCRGTVLQKEWYYKSRAMIYAEKVGPSSLCLCLKWSKGCVFIMYN